MNPLNYVRGILIRETFVKEDTVNHGLEIMYCLLTNDNQLLLTTNLALFQFMITNSETIEDLLQKANKKFQKIVFEEAKVKLINIFNNIRSVI